MNACCTYPVCTVLHGAGGHAAHTGYVDFVRDWAVRHISRRGALHISGMYTKTSVEVSFEVHTSGRKAAKARSVRGMYKRTVLQGRFCVHTRYVQPTAPSAWDGNGIAEGDVHTTYVHPKPERTARSGPSREGRPEKAVRKAPRKRRASGGGTPCARRGGIPAIGSGYFQKNPYICMIDTK